MLTRAEKEKRVIELHEQDAPYRTIAKEVHVSLGRISSIIKRHNGELEVKGGNGEQRQREETIDTQVFKLLEDGKTPVEVAIALNLESDEVTRLHKEWLKLNGLQQLRELYEEIGDDIFQFHKTHKFIKDKGYAPGQLIDVAEHLEELPLLRTEREQLKQENQNLDEQKQNKLIELQKTNESVAIAERNLNTINLGIEVNNEELNRVHQEKLQVQSLIASAYNSAGCERIRNIAVAAVRSILIQNKPVLFAALRALLHALKEEPRNELQFLIYGLSSYPLYEPGNANRPQNYIQMRQALLLESAEEMYKDLLANAVNNTLSSAANMIYDQSSFSRYKSARKANQYWI